MSPRWSTGNLRDIQGPKLGDIPRNAPQQWQPLDELKGHGLFERQGFESWTQAEKELWHQGELHSKWGIGQVTVRIPTASKVSLLALVYGFLPFIIPLWFAVSVFGDYLQNGRYHIFPYFGLLISVSFALVNEVITKQLCKRLMDPRLVARPAEAACKKGGMPSGHVMNAYTLMVWTLLEVVTDTAIHPEWLVVILLVMAPVPWARVHNRDHTFGQVWVSACIAQFMGVLAFVLRKTSFPEVAEPWRALHLLTPK